LNYGSIIKALSTPKILGTATIRLMRYLKFIRIVIEYSWYILLTIWQLLEHNYKRER